MIALLIAAEVLAATPQPFAGPRSGLTGDHVLLCPASGRTQAALPQVYRPRDGVHAFRLIDLPPGHLCLAGGVRK